jgi:hypothetical protein
MSLHSFCSTQWTTFSKAVATTKWFAPEFFIIGILLMMLGFLSLETVSVHDYNKEPVALMAKVKAQTTVIVAQASIKVNQK